MSIETEDFFASKLDYTFSSLEATRDNESTLRLLLHKHVVGSFNYHDSTFYHAEATSIASHSHECSFVLSNCAVFNHINQP